MSLPTLLGYQRASAFVNATKLASQPQFSSDEEYKISNTFFIDIDHINIDIDTYSSSKLLVDKIILVVLFVYIGTGKMQAFPT